MPSVGRHETHYVRFVKDGDPNLPSQHELWAILQLFKNERSFIIEVQEKQWAFALRRSYKKLNKTSKLDYEKAQKRYLGRLLGV